MSHVPTQVLSSRELADLSGFERRHIPRKAAKGEIPDARRTKGGRHWEFPMTQNLRAWICFYRVRHILLRKDRSAMKDQTLRAWGTDWKYALETFDYLKAAPSGSVDCGDLGVFRLGERTTWESVEAIVLKHGLMPRKGWRSVQGDRSSDSQR
jgi:hypothetical protein